MATTRWFAPALCTKRNAFYGIDKATADKYGITALEQMKDPAIKALFDTDGDGKANLTGCNPGWGCEKVIEHHLDAYELRDHVNNDKGEYFALMADTIARYNAGEAVFYSTWAPNWIMGTQRRCCCLNAPSPHFRVIKAQIRNGQTG